jgi:membrane protease YdiL (CAAX protease family)
MAIDRGPATSEPARCTPSGSPESRLVTPPKPLAFGALLLALSIPFWLADAATGVVLPVNLPVSSLMAFCPAVAALILVHRADGAAGAKRLLRRAFDTSGMGVRWYPPALLLMPGIGLCAYAVMRVVGRATPDPHIPLLTIPVAFVVFFATAVGEEIGWSGYVLGPVQARRGALGAGVVVGAAWALWHVPGWLSLHSPVWTAWQLQFTIAARVVMVWLFNDTGGSVFAVILFHTMINVDYALFPNGGSHYDPAVVGPLTAIVAVTVTLVARRRRRGSGSLATRY